MNRSLQTMNLTTEKHTTRFKWKERKLGACCLGFEDKLQVAKQITIFRPQEELYLFTVRVIAL